MVAGWKGKDMLSKELELTLNLAFKTAKEKRHVFITVEHLLLALLDNTSALQILKFFNANVEHLRLSLKAYIDETTPLIPPTEQHRETQPTLEFQRVLQRAVFHVQSAGKEEVSGANVLAALFSEKESQAVHFLELEKVTREEVVRFIAKGGLKSDELGDNEMSAPSDDESSPDMPHRSALESYTVNLNQMAKNGKIDVLIGREAELERAVQVLCRRRKNNPLFVGEAGVGKTAIAEGLAKMIVDGTVKEPLKNSTIYALDLGSLLAGTKYRGDFEKRLKGLLHQLKKEPGAILFIDEIHTIIGAGAASGGVMDASNLIKPILASGELKCMGSTTFQEYRGIFEKDRALARRFQRIDVKEPTVEETVSILKGLKETFEVHHGVRYSNSALRAAVQMSNRYISDRFLPDKAIDVIDEAGAYQKLQPSTRKRKIIGINDIERVIAKMARVPRKSVSVSDKNMLQNLERNLKLVIFGQDEAVETLGDAIKMGRSGLGDLEKPVGSFLFSGPTGVGKTEVSKQLAQLLGIELLRFDMSEYMERHMASRLIGAPPGYVGFEQGGLLTDAVTKHPHCVLLLDEIEKASPEIYNLLLQVMDHGSLTDSNGRKADFRHVILIMTTNAGAEELSRSTLGFVEQDNSSDGMQILQKRFTPEFRNRLDAIVQFHELQPTSIDMIVEKFVSELQGKLEEKHVTLEIDAAARTWLAVNGYDKKMGARPMARLIKESLKKPLADELLFGNLASGGLVSVSIINDKIHLKMDALCKKPA